MMMAVKSLDQQLADALLEHETLILKGYSFDVRDDLGVVVARGDLVRGIWRCQPHKLSWTPAGSFEPSVYVGTVEDAVNFTLTLAQASSPT